MTLLQKFDALGRSSRVATLSSVLIPAMLPVAGVQAAKTGFAIEEVVVTARKREESLQDTPISVAAFTADDLSNRQIDSSDQLTQVTPNLSFSSHAPSAGNNASSQIFIRGIGQTEFLPSTDPGVGLYIDEVYMARSVGATLNFVDLAQIEILRGPQGTLFGRNTIGGAINLTTRRPAEEFGGSLEVKLGTDDRLDVQASLDMPISDTLRTAVSVGSRKRDGYVTRVLDGTDLGNDDSMGGRVALEWNATNNIEVYFAADYVKEEENGAPISFNGLAPNLFANLAAGGVLVGSGCGGLDPSLQARCASRDWDAGPYANYGTFAVDSYFESWGSSLTVKWDLEAFSIKSITAYRDMEWTGSRDADNTPLTILHTRNDDTQDQFSQEFQFSGTGFDDRLNWLLGLYYFEESASDDYFVPVAVGTFNSGGLVENDSKAVFGQLSYDLTHDLSLTLGLRWTEENKAFKPLQFAETQYLFPITPGESDGLAGYVHPFDGNTYPTLGGGGTTAIVPAGTLFFPQVWQDETYSDTTPMVNLSYQLDEDIMLYASYSEGFKSGGFNARNIKPGAAVRSFEPETAETFELGFKAELFDNTLRLNGAIFTTDYTDLQFVIREDFAPIIFNAGEAQIDGVELEWTWVPTPDIQVVGGIGFVDAEYKELSDVLQSGGVSLNNDMPHVPKLSANLGVAYSFNLGDAGVITPRIDWSYRDDVVFDALNSEEIAQEAYDIVNASLIWDSPSESWRVAASVSNVTDELYRLAGNTAIREASSYSEVTYARGREWSLSLKYLF
ncbi:TonB-dependent receptor [Pseudomaricurvus alkylphenolicus]|uniref:TonB-dependent receptor n=1 Tax=Pseudomaricurvus alkylphenolicus TaxID=1306991 RepID=UPI00141F421A|nr:TonB-dependent receptor [Pseudomaricurvus alkylphenolicus]NIB43465.1 TonB-dependent receptor [Pseudomaricurvus alkylphenolicus]